MLSQFFSRDWCPCSSPPLTCTVRKPLRCEEAPPVWPTAGAAGWAVPREGLLAFLKILSHHRQGGLENMEVGVHTDRQGARCPR